MFLLAVKKSHLSERVMARSVLLNCPIKAYIRQMIANQIWEFCYKYDYKHNCPSFWPIYFLQVKQADRYITVRLQKTVNTWFWQVNCVVTNHNKFRTCEQTSKTNHELITVAFSVFFFLTPDWLFSWMHNNVPCHTDGSLSGQDDENPLLWLTTWAGEKGLRSCLLGNASFVPPKNI